jgi:hypothetical protein
MADVALNGVIYIAFLCVCAIIIRPRFAHFDRHFSEISLCSLRFLPYVMRWHSKQPYSTPLMKNKQNIKSGVYSMLFKWRFNFIWILRNGEKQVRRIRFDESFILIDACYTKTPISIQINYYAAIPSTKFWVSLYISAQRFILS